MKCFECQADAVGVCSRCARGLCPAHATFSVERMSCKGRCETELKAFYEKSDAMMAAGPSPDEVARTAALVSGTRTRITIVYFVLGGLLTAYGIYGWGWPGSYLYLGGGAVVVLLGLSSILGARRRAASVRKSDRPS